MRREPSRLHQPLTVHPLSSGQHQVRLGDSGQGGGSAPWQHHCRGGGGAQPLGLTNIEVWPLARLHDQAAKALMKWEDVEGGVIINLKSATNNYYGCFNGQFVHH